MTEQENDDRAGGRFMKGGGGGAMTGQGDIDRGRDNGRVGEQYQTGQTKQSKDNDRAGGQ